MHLGFSISATAAIIGVAVIMVLEVTMATMFPMVTNLDESYKEMSKRAIENIQTEIEIQNITVQINGSLHDLSIQIKNSGSTVIENANVDLLINGTLSEFITSEEFWFPESNYTIRANGISGSGLQRVKLITKNGISDYDTYVV
jgi:archaellum component FlaF (FlaF/FlaG flagellin family)